MEYIPKRTTEIILPIIQKRCEIGTIIISERYGIIKYLENYGYPHYVFDRKKGFLDESNEKIHVQHTVMLWKWSKMRIKAKNRSAKHLQEHLIEFL